MSSSGALKPPSQTLNFKLKWGVSLKSGVLSCWPCQQVNFNWIRFPCFSFTRGNRKEEWVGCPDPTLGYIQMSTCPKIEFVPPESFHLNGHPSLSRLRVANKRRPFSFTSWAGAWSARSARSVSVYRQGSAWLHASWQWDGGPTFEKRRWLQKIASQQCTSRVGWWSEDQRMWVNELHTEWDQKEPKKMGSECVNIH